MSRVLTGTTVVRNPRNARVVVLHAGSKLPKWAEDLVGDHLTAGGQTTAGGGATTPADPVVPVAPVEDTPPASTGGDEVVVEATEPPRAGRGSGIEPWKAYAASLGIEVPEDATRDSIVELVDDHTGK
jgi:hypothetical protein